MDYDIYYDQKGDGTFLLHFPNYKGLCQTEVEDIFSEFGDVIVDLRGNTHGLCFIKYQNLNDVKCCLDGLKNHAFIKILPHKSKVSLNSNKKNNQNKNNQHTLVLQTKQNQKNTNNMKNKTKSHQTGDKISDCDIPKLLDTKDDTSYNGHTTETDYCSDASIAASRLSLNQFYKLKMLQTAVSTAASSSNVDESIKRYEEMSCKSQIPPLICKSQNLTKSSAKFAKTVNIILAQEVVVANIHPGLGIHYILHLFEEHNPLGVSRMMTASKTGIKYCYVYFETSVDAIAVEQKFDAHILHGSSLIVLRSYKLKEEALSL